MPAPVPVVVRHGRATDLLTLAGAAGAAQYGQRSAEIANQQAQDNWRLQYHGYLRALDRDSALMENEMARRVKDNALYNEPFTKDARQMEMRQTELDRQFQAKQQATELQDAYRTKVLDQRESAAEDKLKLAKEKFEAQKAGLIGSQKGRSAASLKLVPAEGDIAGADSPPEWQEGPFGPVMVSTHGPRGEMVPSDVRSAMDAADMVTGIDEPTRAAIKQGIRTGSLDPQKAWTVFNTLGAPNEQAGKIEKAAQQNEIDTALVDAALSGPPAAALRFAREMFKDDYRFVAKLKDESAALMALREEKSRLAALGGVLGQMRPVANSGGRSPLGGNDPAAQARASQIQAPQPMNDLPVLTREQYLAAPPGTRYRTPDGRSGVKR